MAAKHLWSPLTNALASMKDCKRSMSPKQIIEIFNNSWPHPSLSLLPAPQLDLLPLFNRANNLSRKLPEKTILLTAMTVAKWILIGGQFLPTLIPVRNTISRS